MRPAAASPQSFPRAAPKANCPAAASPQSSPRVAPKDPEPTPQKTRPAPSGSEVFQCVFPTQSDDNDSDDDDDAFEPPAEQAGAAVPSLEVQFTREDLADLRTVGLRKLCAKQDLAWVGTM